MDAREPEAKSPPTPTPTNPPPGPDRRIVTYTILAGSALTLLGVLAARPHRGPRPTPPPVAPVAVAPAPRPPEPPEPIVETPAAPAAVAARPQVELVFALDTTSSMTNLIEGAKQKIWSLASYVAHGQPTPDLRVGLVAYRDIGDAYVTKVYDLDGDLDRVYRRLRAFRAEGGGDTPEHVARALDEAVHKMSWSQAPSVVKVLYLVGDAPPHTDYADGYDAPRAARAAKARGIQVHTIECGNDPQTEASWRRIAMLGGGQFMAIGQDGGMHEERTRYDDELARLSDELGGTAIAYGAAGGAASEALKDAEKAPAAVKAARAEFLAPKGKAVAGKGDLVDAIGSGRVRLEEVQADLPPAMKALDKTKQAAVIAKKAEERKEINKRIDELSKLRRAELDRREAAAHEAGVVDGFDAVAKRALKKSVEDNALSGLTM